MHIGCNYAEYNPSSGLANIHIMQYPSGANALGTAPQRYGAPSLNGLANSDMRYTLDAYIVGYNSSNGLANSTVIQNRMKMCWGKAPQIEEPHWL